jgi:CxC5 like cysteine cluster associated with KDZ transposases
MRISIPTKVHAMAQQLKLLLHTKSNQFKSKRVLPISHYKIKPVHLLCSRTFTCTTAICTPCSLIQLSRDQDIPCTKLIIGTITHNDVPVLTGKCPTCDTHYTADHEHFQVG